MRFPQELHLSSKDTHRLKVKGWKTIFQKNIIQKKVSIVIYISDKIYFKKRQGRSLYNDKGISISKRYNNPKDIWSLHSSTEKLLSKC